MKEIDQENKKIVVLRALQVGDMLCSVPFLRALRNSNPTAEITLVGLPWAKDFTNRFSSYIDNFIEFPGFPGLPEQKVKYDKFSNFLANIQSKNFDLSIQLQGNGTIVNPLISLFGAKESAGFYTKSSYKPGDLYIKYPEGIHEIRRCLSLLKVLNITSSGEYLEFPVFEKEGEEAEIIKFYFKLQKGNYAVLHPGARDAKRRIEPIIFSTLGDYLSNLGLKVVVTGSQEEKDICGRVCAGMKNKCVNLSGVTSLGALSEIIRDSLLMISNDTGVSHIASAVNSKSLVLFTISDPIRWAPLNNNLHKSIVYSNGVSLNNIISEVKSLLGLKQFSKYLKSYTYVH